MRIKPFIILWVPSHVDIWGNDTVVELVTMGDHDACVSVPVSTFCLKKTLAKKSLRTIWNERWLASSHSPELHSLLPSLLTNRNHIFGTHTTRTMARLRTGHCGVPSFIDMDLLTQTFAPPVQFKVFQNTWAASLTFLFVVQIGLTTVNLDVFSLKCSVTESLRSNLCYLHHCLWGFKFVLLML